MKNHQIPLVLVSTLAATLCTGTRTLQADTLPSSVIWGKVANNQDTIPGTIMLFNSYNQPSINASGHLVMRARSKGPNPMSGIYEKDMLVTNGQLARIADRTSIVPPPNNTSFMGDGTLATFNEFPSIPRIAIWSTTSATRGNSTPVWTYQLDGADTKIGTTGIYVHRGTQLLTGIGLLGAVPAPPEPVIGENYFPYMAVPGAIPATRFDVFPGSPALADGDWIVFKGNYTEDGVGKTGVFYRDPVGQGGIAPVALIANTSTLIPNLPAGVSGITFGSTAPPSAAGVRMVFAGYDNEDSPTYGGIYLAPLTPNPVLTTLVGIGDSVPGETDATFTKFGEALSFDGRYVAFWGAWGDEVIQLHLDCPEDGNADVLAYCKQLYPDGFDTSVPANQGIFAFDTQTNTLHRVARNGGGIADFVYWNFSGKPPGVGGGDETDGELPRWRSTSFLAVSGGPQNTFTVAFKARSGEIDPTEHVYLNPVDGIYLADPSSMVTLVDTTMDGQKLDPAAPEGSTISALGIEREGFRGRWLAITAAMLEPVTLESMAGVYVSRVISPLTKEQILKGKYLPEPQPVAENKPRLTSLKVNSKGRFSASIAHGKKTYSSNGVFGANGTATSQLRTASGTLVVTLIAGKVSGIPVVDVAITGGQLNYNGLAVWASDK